jgi:nitrate reductase NapE component
MDTETFLKTYWLACICCPLYLVLERKDYKNFCDENNYNLWPFTIVVIGTGLIPVLNYVFVVGVFGLIVYYTKLLINSIPIFIILIKHWKNKEIRRVTWKAIKLVFTE